MGRPWPSSTAPTIICLRSGRWSLLMTSTAEGIPAFTFEVDGGGVEEDQLELGEQVTPLSEEHLLDEHVAPERLVRPVSILARVVPSGSQLAVRPSLPTKGYGHD